MREWISGSVSRWASDLDVGLRAMQSVVLIVLYRVLVVCALVRLHLAVRLPT